MAILERVLGGNIFSDFWKHLRQFIFSENRLFQLLTLQPVEIYKASTEIEIDHAKVKLDIKSDLENLMQRRIDRTIDLLTLNFSGRQKDAFVYDFDVLIKAQMEYEEVSKFFNHHFADQSYTIEEKKYYLEIKKFHFGSQGTKAVVEMPFELDAKWWLIRRKMAGTAVFKGSVNFHHPKYVVKTRNLNYDLETDSFILKVIDRFYHKELVSFLHDFLQYNFKEELFLAKVEAQLQINSFQHQTSWINGNINELDLERITIEPEGIHAVFLAKGKLHVIR
jgi:hypothetical protein